MNAKLGQIISKLFYLSNWDFWCKGPQELILFLWGVNCNKIR